MSEDGVFDVPDPEQDREGWRVGSLTSRYDIAVAAVAKGHALRAELSLDVLPGAVSNHFLDYIRSTEARAAEAMVELCKVDPTDRYEILRLQREIEPYANVMVWLDGIFTEEARGEEEIEVEAEAAAEEGDF